MKHIYTLFASFSVLINIMSYFYGTPLLFFEFYNVWHTKWVSLESLLTFLISPYCIYTDTRLLILQLNKPIHYKMKTTPMVSSKTS